MRTSIAVDEAEHLGVIEITGPTDFEDVLHLHDALGERFDQGHVSLVIDLSGADLRFDIADVRKIAQLKPLFGRIAIIAGDDLQYGIARAYESYSRLFASCSVAVFRSRAEALHWASHVDCGGELSQGPHKSCIPRWRPPR